ncbi:MAG: hypothetical protein ACRDRK_09355 [Pseudonocardia sp.]
MPCNAPLGRHDHAVLSLSDRLKPWDVVAQRLAATTRVVHRGGRATVFTPRHYPR